MEEIFNCKKCGKCCKSLHLSDIYKDLDRGDGVCIYLTEDNLCSIYNNRPEKCNIDAAYKYFSKSMSYGEYLQLNYNVCKKLQEE